jgi:hypothetical protein
MADEQKHGAVVGLVGGPWGEQEVFVPTLPNMPDSITFPVRWHDGSWDNAHWHWRYVLRGTPETGWYYETGPEPVSVPGLTKKEREQQDAKKAELLAKPAP